MKVKTLNMKTKIILLFSLFILMMSTGAFAADVTCVAQKITSNQISQTCGSATIPSNSTVKTDIFCDDYKITVDCDLYNHAFKLSLTIVGPNGATATVSQKTDLHLTDSNGNGALVNCSY